MHHAQQIVADEQIAVPPKTATRAAAETPQAYTGPTIGAAQNVRRAPTVGYRWSLD